MNEEILDIYDENMKKVGSESRNIVHKLGLWHETFQCWIIKDRKYLIFQKRARNKETFPNLYDISSAGHLTAGEKVQEGIRELNEELGVDVRFNQLIDIGIMKQQMEGKNFIDNEFCHVFLLKLNKELEDYSIQKEELSGLIKIEICEFEKLLYNHKKIIVGEGFLIDEKENRATVHEYLSEKDFVPHTLEYYFHILRASKKI